MPDNRININFFSYFYMDCYIRPVNIYFKI